MGVINKVRITDGPEGLYDIEAKTLTGLTASVAELNQLDGVTENVNTSITNLKNNKVTGPASATTNGIPVFDGTGGKAIKNSGTTIADLQKDVTTSAHGLMSSTDKTKLDGIEANANNYTHPNSGVVAGTYKSVTVDAKGHVTSGTNPTTLAGYGITDAKISGNTITLGGNSVNVITSVPKSGVDIKVQSSQPSGQSSGDFWYKVI